MGGLVVGAVNAHSTRMAAKTSMKSADASQWNADLAAAKLILEIEEGQKNDTQPFSSSAMILLLMVLHQDFNQDFQRLLGILSRPWPRASQYKLWDRAPMPRAPGPRSSECWKHENFD